MWSSRVAVIAGFVVAFASVTGCATESSEKGSEDVGAVESELRLSGTRYLGKIASGETRTGYYYNSPRYRSFAFDAKGGDAITVDIKSLDGDAVGYLTTSSYDVVAYNDDHGDSLDSHLTLKIPAGAPAGSYRIVFRDYDLLDATFTVSLAIAAAPDAPKSCAYDSQTYTSGQTFASTDGCNTCTCHPSGYVGCTRRSCTCDPANEPARDYIGTPQQCMTIRYTCSAGKVPFQNSCGCGCETPSP